jgi:phosphate transport system permease protein
MWGMFVLVPLMMNHVQPPLINFFSNIPGLNYIFGGIPSGLGIFTAGIILAIMIIPLISSMMRDVLNHVPDLILEASYGVGATRFEVVRHVLVSYARAGLLGGVILGLGRALGETMAVTFVLGNSPVLPAGLFMPGTTISASIANEFQNAMGHLYPSALLELSLILFVITLITLIISRFFLTRATTRGGSQ